MDLPYFIPCFCSNLSTAFTRRSITRQPNGAVQINENERQPKWGEPKKKNKTEQKVEKQDGKKAFNKKKQQQSIH